MKFVTNYWIASIAIPLICGAIVLTAAQCANADTANELYEKGYKEYMENNYVGALEFLSAYKFHPDSKNADPERMKKIEEVIHFSEDCLTKCTCSNQVHTGGGGTFGGKMKLKKQE